MPLTTHDCGLRPAVSPKKARAADLDVLRSTIAHEAAAAPISVAQIMTKTGAEKVDAKGQVRLMIALGLLSEHPVPGQPPQYRAIFHRVRLWRSAGRPTAIGWHRAALVKGGA